MTIINTSPISQSFTSEELAAHSRLTAARIYATSASFGGDDNTDGGVIRYADGTVEEVAWAAPRYTITGHVTSSEGYKATKVVTDPFRTHADDGKGHSARTSIKRLLRRATRRQLRASLLREAAEVITEGVVDARL
jgi:phage baseplate assembly protein gpV